MHISKIYCRKFSKKKRRRKKRRRRKERRKRRKTTTTVTGRGNVQKLDFVTTETGGYESIKGLKLYMLYKVKLMKIQQFLISMC